MTDEPDDPEGPGPDKPVEWADELRTPPLEASEAAAPGEEFEAVEPDLAGGEDKENGANGGNPDDIVQNADGEAAGAAEPNSAVPNAAELEEQARDQVAKLLAVAEIETVVCVDDNFEPDISVILDAISNAEEAVSNKVAEQLGTTIDGDPAETRSIWGPDVEQAWSELGAYEQRRYASGVMRLLEEQDQPDAGHLADFLPDDVTFLPIIAEEWTHTQKQKVLAGETGKTLVLFDRAHGTEPDLGIKLAADLHEADETGTVWAGLLTHTVKPHEELGQGPVLAASDGRIVAERFVVISKQHLETSPSTLPHGLKVTLMSPAAHRLRTEVSKAIVGGAEGAADSLKLDPYEFERAVFTTAATEGIWEPDMLLRLFNVLIRNDVHKTLHDNENIAVDTALLRRFSAVDLDPNENQSFAGAHRIRRLEIYEEPDHLNGRHLPIELGDIFEIVNGDIVKTVILVEQPCDLMVRSKNGAGKRGNSLTHAHLIELKYEAHSQFGFMLPAYEDGAPWHAWLPKMIVVPFEALDFCVYDSEGRSQLDTESAAPAGLWPAWEARHGILKKTARQLVTAVTADAVTTLTDEGFRDEFIKHRTSAHYAATKPLVCTVDGNTVRFNVQRINRLLSPYNRALLGEHSAYRARADFEPDFPAQ